MFKGTLVNRSCLSLNGGLLEITATVLVRTDIFRYFCRMGKGEGKGKAAAHFDEGTLEVYKECFRLMDIDKDGVINKTDLR